MARITSRQNAVVTQFRDAARGTARDVMLLDGTHLIAEALASGIRLQRVLVSSGHDAHAEVSQLVQEVVRRGAELLYATPSVMAAASPVRSSSPIVALAARPAWAADIFRGTPPLVVIASDVQDPGNLGAIVRVCEAAGATGLIVTAQTADPFGWKALRGSMGSALRLPMAARPSAAEAVAAARARGLSVAAMHPHDGTSMYAVRLTGPLALIVGAEGAGLPPPVLAAADHRLSIPMAAPVESLNAAVATAVLLYEARRQRSAPASREGLDGHALS